MVKKIILIILFLAVNLYADSYTPHSSVYLVYFSSLTAANRTTVNNSLLIASKDATYASQRFQWIYNSTSAVCIVSGYRDGAIKFDVSTSRAIIIVDAKYDSILASFISSGKIKKLATIYDKIIGNQRIMVEEKYINYPVPRENPDWNKYVYVVDTSTR